MSSLGTLYDIKKERLVDAETGQRLVSTVSSWLISLPHDLKILYEAASDENLQRDQRELAVGAIIYAVSPNDFIAADRSDFLSYLDDCILVRLALCEIASAGDEDSEFFKSRFSDFFDTVDDELAAVNSAIGDTMDWLKTKVPQLRTLEYRGKKAPAYLDDDEAGEFLYEEGLGFATEYPVDEESLADKLKKASTILEALETWRRE
jgi:uncharacterized membrane protein YkvA (DUF1232 family)